MKKVIIMFLSLLLIIPIITSKPPSASAIGEAWKKEYIKDVFGDVTDEYCLINSKRLTGTYNSESITNGKMTADIVFEHDGAYISAYIAIYLDTTERLKNGAQLDVAYDVRVKRADGSQFSCRATMPAGTDRLKLAGTIDLVDALSAGSGEISVYIESSSQSINNYLFKAACGNFGKLLNDEIIVPYQEEKYERAEAYLASKKYDDAITVFEELGEFRDAKKRAAEALEAKNVDAYAKAEALLTAGDYDAAADAFKALGNYKDSARRVYEVYETQKADAYAQAEALLTVGDYDAAYLAFSQILGYKDVDTLLKTDHNLIAAAQNANLEPYKTVGNIVSFGMYEQDNSTSNGKEDIEWIVLETKDNQSLLISRYALDCQLYNQKFESTTWESCSLRSWLNGTFLNTAFSSVEREAILKTTVDNSNSQGNSEWSTFSGKNTTDQIFLLSYSEAGMYFCSDTERICKPTTYALAQGAYKEGSDCCWWLRSPGYLQYFAAYVLPDGSLGYHNRVNIDDNAVRPAFWIDLESAFFKS